ncbi:MAG: Gfo/Idh/MocA family oxidoreductase [Oscillospiraceae bacterium]|jgi:predicted dehydrogenase|nr:Gfo/Idh/MocA family oxidoreductase [Oscillospiraceae bacterium]
MNIGIIGTGNIARKFAEAANFTKDVKLFAVASRTIEKAEKFSKIYNIDCFYGSYEELVKNESIDIVYIATPMSEHYNNVKLCFEYNKGVICEKTICCNSKEFSELIDISKEKGLFFTEAMWTKCLPSFKKAIEWKEKIGEVKAVKACFCFFAEYNPNSRLFSKDLGGGASLDLLAYPLTIITAFLGFDYKELKSSVYMKNGVDIDETVILEYDNAFGVADCSFCYNGDNTAVIIGTKGRIEFESGFWYAETVNLYNEKGILTETFTEKHKCNGYEYEIEEVNNCFKKGKTESEDMPLNETFKILKIIEKFRDSCE